MEGPRVVAVHAQPNENAWLLAYATLHGHVGMVGARGVEASLSKYSSTSASARLARR